jgi:predicted  nucleic acid-binding Zn-ribbon protein
MPHQCVHCGRIYEDASEELLKGCECGSHFFFYIRKEQIKKDKKPDIVNLDKEDKDRIEKDVREIIGVEEEEPVILDLESVQVLKPGKFKLDIVKLFNQKSPLIYKLEEGKYIVDLASTFKASKK